MRWLAAPTVTLPVPTAVPRTTLAPSHTTGLTDLIGTTGRARSAASGKRRTAPNRIACGWRFTLVRFAFGLGNSSLLAPPAGTSSLCLLVRTKCRTTVAGTCLRGSPASRARTAPRPSVATASALLPLAAQTRRSPNMRLKLSARPPCLTSCPPPFRLHLAPPSAIHETVPTAHLRAARGRCRRPRRNVSAVR